LSEELDVLKLVAQILDEQEISYMITGSIAANYYTIPRMTRDIDVIVELHSDVIDNTYTAFKSEFYIDRQMISEAIAKQSSFNIIHNKTLVKVDFIVKKDSEYRREEFGRRKRVEIDEASINITAPEDLIISKLYWAKDSHSEMQLRDVKNLSEDLCNINRPYLEKWVKKLGLEKIYEEALK